MLEPKLPLTVSRQLWDAVADAVNPNFADSYLSGATQFGTRVTPHTVIAFERIMANEQARRCFADLQLLKPLPFGHPDRPDYARSQEVRRNMK